MRRTSLVITAASVVVAILAFESRHAPASDPPTTAASEVHHFGTKILMVNMITGGGMQPSQSSQLLKNATLIKIGDRYFVHGTGFVAKRNKDDARYQWYEGVDVAYAWSNIEQYVTFTDDELDKYLDSTEKTSK